jgi:hypothetical protein
MEFFKINERLSKREKSRLKRVTISPAKKLRKSIDSDELEDEHLVKLSNEVEVSPIPFDRDDFNDCVEGKFIVYIILRP